jgi:RNA polymerase sigma-70 factor (ECF subfamily)
MSSEASQKSEGDRYLLDHIRAGDPNAFRQLVDRFSGRLTAYAARRLIGSGIDPEDAVQETFLGLLQNVERDGDKLAQVRSLEAYMFQILRNKVYDLAQRRPEAHGLQRIPLASEDEAGERRGYEPVAADVTPSSHARRAEESAARKEVLADILDELISSLKEEKSFRDLKVLELLFLSPLKNRDIAAAVGTSEPTVTRTKQFALESLARFAQRHPRGRDGIPLPEKEEDLSGLIRDAWKSHLLSCVKRSTLGAHLLGTLDREWKDFVAFHLDIVGCEACAANLQDLKSEGTTTAAASRERVFQSSVGFLRRMGR